MPITGLFVTYNDVLAPGGYHRVTTADRGPANINEHNGSEVQSYLWYSDGAAAGAPITDVVVIDGAEEVPEGFEKIKRSVTKGGGGERTYLCVKRGTAEDAVPVSALCIVFGDARPANEAFVEVGRPLDAGATPVRLFFKRSRGESGGWTGEQLALHDWVDALDTENVWRVAQVIETTETTVRIHYKNWGSKWDDTIPRTSPKLAPVGTHTSGKDTGWKKRTVGATWAVTPEEVSAFKERIRTAHEARKSGVETGAGSAFWVVDLPNFVEGCMTSQFEDPEVLPLVLDLLRFVIDVIVENIGDLSRPVLPEILQQLQRLTGVDQHCSYFYNRYSRGFVDSISEYLNEPQDYLVVQRQVALKLLVSMMNYFGRRRGFELIAQRISATPSGDAPPLCGLGELEHYLRAIAYLRMLYAKPFVKSFFKDFHELVLTRLSNVSNDELKAIPQPSNDAIEVVLNQMDILLRDVRPDLNTEEILEKFKMRMAKRLIVSPLLNYRIKGISHVNDMLASLASYEAQKSTYMNLSRAALPRPLLSADWAADFLLAENLPALVLGDEAVLAAQRAPDTHIELVKRSADMLLFLATQGRFPDELLDVLWRAAQDASQERAVLGILASVTRKLSPEQLDLMDRTLRAKLPATLEEAHVALIRELAEASLPMVREKGSLSYGLDLLWNMLVAPECPGAMREPLLDALCDITSRDATLTALGLLSAAALDKLRAGVSVTSALEGLHRMLAGLPTSRAAAPRGRGVAKSRERVLLDMHTEHQLLQRCIDEFERFHAPESAPDIAAAARAVSTRLDFLAFLLQNSTVELAFPQILQLYNAGTASPLYPEEANTVLRWLADVAPQEALLPTRAAPMATMSRDTLFQVFEQLLCSAEAAAHFANLSENGYKCIERYFKLVNSALRPAKLRFEADGRLVVEAADLQGFEVLWSILRVAESESVRLLASEFIILLQIQLSPRLSKRQVWEAFIQRCLRTLAKLPPQDEATKGDPALPVLRLLRTFLLEIKMPDVEITAASKPNLASTPLLVLGPEEALLRALIRASGKKSGLHRECRLVVEPRITTVGNLRQRLAKLLRHPPTQLRILNRRGEYLPVDRFDGGSLEKAGLAQYGVVEVDLRQEEGVDTASYMHLPKPPAAENERLAPLYALARSEDDFSLLFRFLHGGVERMEEAWALVDLLPLNEALVEEVRNLDPEGSFLNAEATLDSASVPRMLYQLKIATGMVEASLDPHLAGESKAAADAWMSAFVTKGGIGFLLRLLTRSDVRALASSHLGKNALTAVLRLTSLFAQGLETPPGAPAGSPLGSTAETGVGEEAGGYAEEVRRVLVNDMEEADILRLMERLLEVVHLVASTAQARIASPEEQARLKEQRKEEQRRRRYESFRSMAQQTGGKPVEREGSFLGDADDAEDAGSGGPKSPESPEGQVCRNAMALLVAVARSHPRVLSLLAAQGVVADAALCGILRNPSEGIRRVVARGMVKVCEVHQGQTEGGGLAPRVTAVLCGALEGIDDHARQARELFLTLGRLAQCPGALDAVDLPALCRRLRDALLQEESRGDDPDEIVLAGRASLLRGLLVAARRDALPSAPVMREGLGEADLVEDLFERCLFGVPAGPRSDEDKEEPPRGEAVKAKQAESRKACFELLAELASGGGDTADAVVAKVATHHRFPPKGRLGGGDDAEIEVGDDDEDGSGGGGRLVRARSALPKSSTGYVGLVNLGCICYLNSILQQLFMMSAFRRAILAFDADEEEAEEGGEDVLVELQRLFAQLQDSEQAACNPRGFCRAFRDWDQQPIDVLVQQDASEFYSNLLTKLESRLMGSAGDELLSGTVRGTVSQELLAEGGKYRSREDVFYSIEVPTLNIKGLEAALEQFIEGETVEYTWEEEEVQADGTKSVKKVNLNTTKRLSLQRLPPHLVIHLKRFDFDYETFQQIKLNDYFEFPTHLNVKAYTQDGRADATPADRRGATDDAPSIPAPDPPEGYYDYDLAGVVIHMGTANSGHYYSYIKERGAEDAWFEFNDTYVGDFDTEDLAAECFGGEEEVHTMYGGYSAGGNAPAPGAASRTYTRRKIQNAFMLIYDQRSSRPSRRASSKGRERCSVPRPLATAIQRENEAFWRQKNILHPHYYAFLSQLLGEGKGGEAGAKLAANFFFGTLYAAREREVLKAWEAQVASILGNQGAARGSWLRQLAAAPEYVEDVYGKCGDGFVQSCVFEALTGILEREVDGLALAFGAAGEKLGDESWTGQEPALEPLVGFLSVLDTTMAKAARQPRRGRSLFRPLEAAAQRWQPLAVRCVDSGLLAKMFVLYLGTPAARDHAVRDIFADFDLETDVARDAYFRYRGLEEASLLPALAAVLRWYSLTGETRTYPHVPSRPLPALLGLERDLATSGLFLGRLALECKTRMLQTRLTPLVWHVACDNEEVTRTFAKELRKALDVQDDADLKKPFRALYALSCLPDALQAWRLRLLVYDTLEVMHASLGFLKATETSVDMLFRWVKRDARVSALLRGDEPHLRFLVEYLEVRARNAYGGAYAQHLYKTKRAGAYLSPSRTPFNARRFLTAFAELRDASPVYKPAARKRWDAPEEGSDVAELSTARLEFTDPGYDSDDDPQALVGARVSVQWREGRRYLGRVEAYDAATHKHRVVYDDGDVREYVMPEKTWDLVDASGMAQPPELEWSDMTLERAVERSA